MLFWRARHCVSSLSTEGRDIFHCLHFWILWYYCDMWWSICCLRLGGVCNWSISNSIFLTLLNFFSSDFSHVMKLSWSESWSNMMSQCEHGCFSPNYTFPVGNRWCINYIACRFLVSVILFREEEWCDQHMSSKVMLFHWYFLRRNIFVSFAWACRLILWCSNL